MYRLATILALTASTAGAQSYPLHRGVMPENWLDETQIETCREEGARAEYVMQRRQAAPLIDVIEAMQQNITDLVDNYESKDEQRLESFFLSEMLDLLMTAYAQPRAATEAEADLAVAEFRDQAVRVCIQREWG